MAFPETRLDARLAPHAGGQWVHVPTYNRDPIEVVTGHRERAAHTDPSRLSITINNRGGRFSPRNPESDLYGLIGRNTRCRLSVPGGEARLEVDGSLDGVASTPDTAARTSPATSTCGGRAKRTGTARAPTCSSASGRR